MVRKLIAYKDGKEVARGDEKQVEITGLSPNTNYPAGTFQVAWDDMPDTKIDVPQTKTLSIAVTGVALNKTTLALKVGASETLSATVSPSNATNKGLEWSSSDTKIATVDNSGKVTAVANGSADITVKTKDGAKTAVCKLTITTAVTGVKLNKATTTIETGKTETLTHTVEPSSASNKNVTYSSDTPAIATVDNNGKITAVKAGTAKITVKTADGGKTAICTVTVTAPPEPNP